MDNNVRITDKTHDFIKGDARDEKSLIRISAAFSDSEEDQDHFVLYSDEKAGNDFDSRIEALKLFNTDLKVPNLFSLTADGRQLSIDAVCPGEDSDFTVPLGLKTNRAGAVTFSAEDIDGSFRGRRVFLLDKVTGIEKELKNHEEYNIALDQGEYLNRFFLNVYASSTVIPDSDAVQREEFNVYCSKGIIVADFLTEYTGQGFLVITNTLGSGMLSFKIPQAGHYEFPHNLKTGIYLVTWQAGSKQVTRKLLIRD
ncbi:MAG: T9SS type A sorting domain-containing protein [Bacteroidales bacterium]|nr:T9SS type A sorting domain-containing protein [Bacteroidales bacterium]